MKRKDKLEPGQRIVCGLVVTNLADVPDLAPGVAQRLGVSEATAADLLRAKGYLDTAAELLGQVLDGRTTKVRKGSAQWRAQAASQILAGQPERTDPVPGFDCADVEGEDEAQ